MDLSLDKLKEAVSLREQIHSLEARLSSLFGGGASSSSSSSSPSSSYTAAPGTRRGIGRGRGKRRPMSAATRAKLAASARARWAAARGETSGSSAPKSTASSKRRGGLTAAGRKKLSDAMKARWAARRKAGGKGR